MKKYISEASSSIYCLCFTWFHSLLTRLYSKYLILIIFHKWITSRMHTLLKKYSKSLPFNYRFITVLCVLSKVMEEVINRSVLEHLRRYELTNDNNADFHTREPLLTSFLTLLLYDRHLLNSKVNHKSYSIFIKNSTNYVAVSDHYSNLGLRVSTTSIIHSRHQRFFSFLILATIMLMSLHANVQNINANGSNYTSIPDLRQMIYFRTYDFIWDLRAYEFIWLTEILVKYLKVSGIFSQLVYVNQMIRLPKS